MNTPARTATFAALLLAGVVACAPEDDSSDDTQSKEPAKLSECTPDQLDLYESGTLTVATDTPAYDPWFSDDDPSNGKGYESAVTYAIADRLGFDKSEVTWTSVPFNTSYQPGEKKFDFDINQVSITEKRAQAVTFSEPYYAAAQAVITMDDSEYADIISLDELKDAKVGAQVGTTSLEAIDQIGPDQEPAIYDDTNQATKALEAGQIDALIADLPSGYYITAAVLDGSKLVGQFQPETGETEEFGLLFEKGNSLVSCVNAAIDDLKSDGTLAELEKKWLSETTKVPELS
ncbi:ABC transporter substrate-binding protein [Solicola gregarius]|uniref:ABC transporter substrate-binding protein n=1 Tax=Solicola gregarius TaxID=2908642 RepID=A0AA46TLM6_9ACTN|nr:ABC transporter substrate-binding protein [Solicola gregarius]UYM07202.1 ABC transporter substrate-binding protein [Solicola gregarius]